MQAPLCCKLRRVSRTPLTNVPLRLARSATAYCSPLTTMIEACLRDTFSSFRTMSHSLRPMV